MDIVIAIWFTIYHDIVWVYKAYPVSRFFILVLWAWTCTRLSRTEAAATTAGVTNKLGSLMLHGFWSVFIVWSSLSGQQVAPRVWTRLTRTFLHDRFCIATVCSKPTTKWGSPLASFTSQELKNNFVDSFFTFYPRISRWLSFLPRTELWTCIDRKTLNFDYLIYWIISSQQIGSNSYLLQWLLVYSNIAGYLTTYLFSKKWEATLMTLSGIIGISPNTMEVFPACILASFRNWR